MDFRTAIIIGCCIRVAVAAVIAVLLLSFYLKKRTATANEIGKYESTDMEAAVVRHRKTGCPNLEIFSYEELREATNCFNEENKIGDGKFGLDYVAKLEDGLTVAIKRLYLDNPRRIEQIINELQIFSVLNNPQLVRVFGYTGADSPEFLVVYEFINNGTLADHLHGHLRRHGGLPWNVRLNIAIQIAKALAFFHSADPLISRRDVKSSNILLDKNFNAKLTGSGLSRPVPRNATHVSTAPQGTPGYVDPEYHQRYQLTLKSDVYSFGVVLMEIISARVVVDHMRQIIYLGNMAISKIEQEALHEFVDPDLKIEKDQQVKVMVSTVANLGFRCLASERARPSPNEIVSQLEEVRRLDWLLEIRLC